MQTTNQNNCDTAETSIATTKTEREIDTTITAINTTNTQNVAFSIYNVVVDNLNELAVNTITTNTPKQQAATPMDAQPQLDVDNENCVIDIATMQIADDSNNTATMPALGRGSNNKHSYTNEHSEPGGVRVEQDAKGEIDIATNAELQSDGDGNGEGEGEEENVQIETEQRSDNEEEVVNQYLDEIEISQVDEEQVITELVDASGQGSCTEA